MQRLTVSLFLFVIILLMSHRQPLLHELFSALGVDADAHWIAGRRGILSKNLPHLVEQTNRRIQKIFGRKPRGMRSHGRSIFICKRRICRSVR